MLLALFDDKLPIDRLIYKSTSKNFGGGGRREAARMINEAFSFSRFPIKSRGITNRKFSIEAKEREAEWVEMKRINSLSLSLSLGVGFPVPHRDLRH